MSEEIATTEQLQEEILKLSADNKALQEANDGLAKENLETMEENLKLKAQVEELSKKKPAEPAAKKSSLSMGKEKSVPKLSGKAVKVNYKTGEQSQSGKFKLLVPSVHYQGKNYTEAEALAHPELMTYLVENTLKRGQSRFVQEVFEK